MTITSQTNANGAQVTTVTIGTKTARKYTHACRNTPQRLRFDTAQCITAATSGATPNKSVVLC